MIIAFIISTLLVMYLTLVLYVERFKLKYFTYIDEKVVYTLQIDKKTIIFDIIVNIFLLCPICIPLTIILIVSHITFMRDCIKYNICIINANKLLKKITFLN